LNNQAAAENAFKEFVDSRISKIPEFYKLNKLVTCLVGKNV